MGITKILGERLRAYRNKAGLSQEQLAEKAGLHATYIGQLERGEKNATIESIEKVARALELPFEILFEKIITSDSDNEIPAKCYEMINSLSQKEQQAIYEIINRMVEYKKI
jgi:transcriptional regulator with XRE-family HTH domain